MGLDMYLYYNVEYEPDNIFDKNKEEYNQFIKHSTGDNAPMATEGIFGKMPTDEESFIDKSFATVERTNVMYWRKANAIHNWFVENVQGGDDDCGTYDVSVEQLVELRHICKQVLQNPEHADSLLPTTSGFFFGDTEYDEYYKSQLERTVEQLDNILTIHQEIEKECSKLNGDTLYGPYGTWFEYRSSW